jgi:hypothetical protein
MSGAGNVLRFPKERKRPYPQPDEADSDFERSVA